MSSVSTVLLPSAGLPPPPTVTPFAVELGNSSTVCRVFLSVLGILEVRTAGELVAMHIVGISTNRDEVCHIIGVGYL